MRTTFILLFFLVPVIQSVPGKSFSPLGGDDLSTLELTQEEKIVAVLRDSGYSAPMQRIILAQAKHESGGFTNSLAVYHNNVFAMLHPSRRRTLSLGPLAKAEGRGGYGSYATIEDATRDYIMYCRHMGIDPKESATDYIYQLKRKRYFTDNVTRYLRGVQQWMKSDTTVRNFSN